MEVFAIVMAFILTLATAFTITYSIVSMYITNKRAVKEKYHFIGSADETIKSFTFEHGEPAVNTTVDNENAMREWSRKNNTSY